MVLDIISYALMALAVGVIIHMFNAYRKKRN